jgi:hypothetical protein
MESNRRTWQDKLPSLFLLFSARRDLGDEYIEQMQGKLSLMHLNQRDESRQKISWYCEQLIWIENQRDERRQKISWYCEKLIWIERNDVYETLQWIADIFVCHAAYGCWPHYKIDAVERLLFGMKIENDKISFDAYRAQWHEDVMKIAHLVLVNENSSPSNGECKRKYSSRKGESEKEILI